MSFFVLLGGGGGGDDKKRVLRWGLISDRMLD